MPKIYVHTCIVPCIHLRRVLVCPVQRACREREYKLKLRTSIKRLCAHERERVGLVREFASGDAQKRLCRKFARDAKRCEYVQFRRWDYEK